MFPMGRPTREQAALSAMLLELRRLEIQATRARWRTCPATMILQPDRSRHCGDCSGVICARMREKGLDDDGMPLPLKDRPQCGARARSGAPCKNKVISGKRRCKFHGGLSTGPKTEVGRARIAAAQKRRWRSWKARHTSNDGNKHKVE